MEKFDVVIAILSLNALKPLKKCIEGCKNEVEIMKNAEFSCHLQVDDNGSNDEATQWLIENLDKKSLTLHSENFGISLVKNFVMRRYNTDYVFYIDSDIVPVHGCVKAFYEYMKLNLQCGLFAFALIDEKGNRTDTQNTDKASKCVDLTRKITTSDNFGYSGFALHRKAMHNHICWNEDGYFAGPGYGYEDMDLGVQIMMFTNYEIHALHEHTFLHFNASSQSTLTHQVFFDSYNKRKKALFKKWEGKINEYGYILPEYRRSCVKNSK